MRLSALQWSAPRLGKTVQQGPNSNSWLGTESTCGSTSYFRSDTVSADAVMKEADGCNFVDVLLGRVRRPQINLNNEVSFGFQASQICAWTATEYHRLFCIELAAASSLMRIILLLITCCVSTRIKRVQYRPLCNKRVSVYLLRNDDFHTRRLIRCFQRLHCWSTERNRHCIYREVCHTSCDYSLKSS